VKRREAIRNLGLGVTASLALPWLTSCSDDEKGPAVKYSGVVGVIGAGAAGLAVADYLISKGIRVKIFDAGARIGGRIISVRPTDTVFKDLVADFHVELGADRVFGSNSEWGNIIKLLKVPTVDFRNAPNSAMDHYIINGEYKSITDIQEEPGILADYNALKNFKDNVLPGYAGGGTMKSAAGASAQLEGVMNSWLGNAYGSSADNIDANAMGTALGLIDQDLQLDEKELMLRVNPMINVLSSRFDKAVKKVQLNKAVKSIAYPAGSDDITLTIKDTETNEETTEIVNKLVVTAPVTVLKDSSLMSFSPALPSSKTSALSRIGMDASVRIILEFNSNEFFGTNPAFIYGGTECPSYFFCGSGRSSSNRTVSMLINGPKAEELSAKTDADKITQVLAELDSVFDGKATQNVRRQLVEDPLAPPGAIIYVVKDWTKEPYILGGVSYPLPGGTNEDREALAEPVNDKLYFAGEATDVKGEFGTVSGALRSGRRAAEEVIASILEANAS
jgi:monoamine oxidase